MNITLVLNIKTLQFFATKRNRRNIASVIMSGDKNNRDLFHSFFVSSEFEFHLKFSNQEQLIGKFVHSVVVEELQDKFKGLKYFHPNTKELAKQLKDLQGLFDTINKERIEILENFVEWTAGRKRYIKEIRELTDTIDPQKFHRKNSILFGNFITIIGGIAVLASLLFPPAAAITPLFTIGGGVTTIIGGMVIMFNYSFFRRLFLERKICRLKTILFEDLRYVDSLKRWFDRASLLIETTDKIMGPHFKKSLPPKPASQEKEYLKWNTRCFTAAMGDNNNNLVDSLGFDLAAIVITFAVMVILRDKQNFETFRLAYDSTQMKRVYKREFLPSHLDYLPCHFFHYPVSQYITEMELNVSETVDCVRQLRNRIETLLDDWIYLNCIFKESIL